MLLRRIALPLLPLALCAADYPPPPAELEPYVKDGHLEPGDYAWMKGRFQDATPEEAEAYRAIMGWAMACRNTALTEVRTALAARGFADPNMQSVLPGPALCRQVVFQPALADNSSFFAFQRELVAAKVVADTFLAAVRLAEEETRPGADADLRRQLEARPIGEQLLRHANTWAQGLHSDSPDLTPGERAIFHARMGPAISARDHANTDWLKSVVVEHGWPTISQVGGEASNQAWLLVQHADHDPVFQLEALRLMEPLVEQGEVSKQNYAYLYDRIMLKLAGKQRYGSQTWCPHGQFEPQPLEDEQRIDALRAEMEMPPLASYLAMVREAYGPCTPLPQG